MTEAMEDWRRATVVSLLAENSGIRDARSGETIMIAHSFLIWNVQKKRQAEVLNYYFCYKNIRE